MDKIRTDFFRSLGRPFVGFQSEGGDGNATMTFPLKDARIVLMNRALLRENGLKIRINLDDKYKCIYLRLYNVPKEFDGEPLFRVFPLRFGKCLKSSTLMRLFYCGHFRCIWNELHLVRCSKYLIFK